MYSSSTKDLHLVCANLFLDSTKCQEATKPGSFMDISSNDIGILSKIQPVSHSMLSFTPHFKVHLIQVKFHFQYLNCSFLQKNSARKCEESGSIKMGFFYKNQSELHEKPPVFNLWTVASCILNSSTVGSHRIFHHYPCLIQNSMVQ